MLKKFLLLSCLGLFSTTVFAYGTYTGLNLSYNNTAYALKDATNAKYSMNTRYPMAGVFVGDGDVINKNFYLGCEAFFNLGTSNTSYRSINNNMVNNKVTSSWTYGADAIPGYAMNDKTLFYGRLGIAGGRFQMRGYVTQPNVNTSNTSYRTFPGARIGLGSMEGFNKNIKVRAEYVYTAYKNLSVMDNAGVRDYLQPSTSQINVALVYEFT